MRLRRVLLKPNLPLPNNPRLNGERWAWLLWLKAHCGAEYFTFNDGDPVVPFYYRDDQ